MIEFEKVTVGYGKRNVLTDISLRLEPGKITAIMGSNGCGKSTLLKSVIGLAQLTDGNISVDGKSVFNLSQKELAKSVSYLSQSKNLPDMTVGQLVLHGRFAHLGYPRRYGKKDYQAAQDAMEQMEISHLAGKSLSELSGGTRQKAYIAMALAQQSPYILLDEPTTFLDISHQLKVCEILKKLAAEGKGIVVVLHDISAALGIAHNVAVMEQGKITAFGSPDEIFSCGALSRAYGVEITKVENGGSFLYDCKLRKSTNEV